MIDQLKCKHAGDFSKLTARSYKASKWKGKVTSYLRIVTLESSN